MFLALLLLTLRLHAMTRPRWLTRAWVVTCGGGGGGGHDHAPWHPAGHAPVPVTLAMAAAPHIHTVHATYTRCTHNIYALCTLHIHVYTCMHMYMRVRAALYFSIFSIFPMCLLGFGDFGFGNLRAL